MVGEVCIPQDVAFINTFLHDVKKLFYYEHWTVKQKKIMYKPIALLNCPF